MSLQDVEHVIADDGVFPNNAALPLRIVPRVFQDDITPQKFERLFRVNGWPPAWRGGIFDYDHYHSTAHEVLGCFSGSALLQFGGGAQVKVAINAGDAVIIPAGVAHRCLCADQFVCVGAYPAGQGWDTCLGQPGERPAADKRIAALGGWVDDPVAR
ncbi:MAG: cupin domain-containing protein [Burkholderiaceae bacterium]